MQRWPITRLRHRHSERLTASTRSSPDPAAENDSSRCFPHRAPRSGRQFFAVFNANPQNAARLIDTAAAVPDPSPLDGNGPRVLLQRGRQQLLRRLQLELACRSDLCRRPQGSDDYQVRNDALLHRRLTGDRRRSRAGASVPDDARSEAAAEWELWRLPSRDRLVGPRFHR